MQCNTGKGRGFCRSKASPLRSAWLGKAGGVGGRGGGGGAEARVCVRRRWGLHKAKVHGDPRASRGDLSRTSVDVGGRRWTSRTSCRRETCAYLPQCASCGPMEPPYIEVSSSITTRSSEPLWKRTMEEEDSVGLTHALKVTDLVRSVGVVPAFGDPPGEEMGYSRRRCVGRRKLGSR